jgi:hypothetical protein
VGAFHPSATRIWFLFGGCGLWPRDLSFGRASPQGHKWGVLCGYDSLVREGAWVVCLGHVLQVSLWRDLTFAPCLPPFVMCITRFAMRIRSGNFSPLGFWGSAGGAPNISGWGFNSDNLILMAKRMTFCPFCHVQVAQLSLRPKGRFGGSNPLEFIGHTQLGHAKRGTRPPTCATNPLQCRTGNSTLP